MAEQNNQNNDIADGVTKIGAHAFESCTDLTHITMYKNTAYSESTFEGCSNLTMERI